MSSFVLHIKMTAPHWRVSWIRWWNPTNRASNWKIIHFSFLSRKKSTKKLSRIAQNKKSILQSALKIFRKVLKFICEEFWLCVCVCVTVCKCLSVCVPVSKCLSVCVCACTKDLFMPLVTLTLSLVQLRSWFIYLSTFHNKLNFNIGYFNEV